MFDRKVSEADTYLQLMIDQTTKIEQRIEVMEVGGEEGEDYEKLRQQANVSWWKAFLSVTNETHFIFPFTFQLMLDHIKHSIVLLQIAKVKVHWIFATFSRDSSSFLIQNTAHPINGIYNGPMKTEPDITATPGNLMSDIVPLNAGE